MERLLGCVARQQVPVVAIVVGVEFVGDVHVCVDEARHQSRVAEIDDACAGWNLRIAPDGHNLIFADHDRCISSQLVADGHEHSRGLQHGDFTGLGRMHGVLKEAGGDSQYGSSNKGHESLPR
jgi:hypothetical protein